MAYVFVCNSHYLILIEDSRYHMFYLLFNTNCNFILFLCVIGMFVCWINLRPWFNLLNLVKFLNSRVCTCWCRIFLWFYDYNVYNYIWNLGGYCHDYHRIIHTDCAYILCGFDVVIIMGWCIFEKKFGFEFIICSFKLMES